MLRVEADPGGGSHVHVRKADGSEVVVTVDPSFNVTGVAERGQRGRGRGGGRGPCDDGEGGAAQSQGDAATGPTTPTSSV